MTFRTNLILLLFLLITPHFVSGQNLQYKELMVANLDSLPSTLEDYLVHLSWKNSPGNRVFQTKVNIAEDKVKVARWEWANDVRATFNLNDISVNRFTNQDDQTNNFFPIYNFSASISLGSIVNNPKKTKIARQEVDIYQADLEQQKLRIRAEVLRRYQEYLFYLELVKNKIEAEEDAYSAYKLVKDQFQSAEVELKDYSTASNIYHNAREATLRAKSDLEKAKISLEELIGVDLEQVLKRYLGK